MDINFAYLERERDSEGERKKSTASGRRIKQQAVMNDGTVITFTFCRESLETEVCTEREIKHNEGVMTLMINVDASAGVRKEVKDKQEEEEKRRKDKSKNRERKNENAVNYIVTMELSADQETVSENQSPHRYSSGLART